MSMTPTDQLSRGLAATKRGLSRPADLHLAWSASKGTGLSSDYFSSVSSASAQQRLAFPSATPRDSMPALSHPYSSFVPQAGDGCSTDASLKSSSSVPTFLPSREPDSHSSSLLLKSGRLTWRSSCETSGRRGALSGFEKALRRRQAAKDQSTYIEKEVVVMLERTAPDSMEWKFPSWNSHTASSNHHLFSEPFLSSPGASDPSAFDNDGLVSFQSRPVPSCLSDSSRWIPPSSWDVLDTSSDGHCSQSRSSTSSVSDPLETPRTSQPNSPGEPEFFLNLYSTNPFKARSTSHGSLQMRLCINRSSTVEMQSCLSELTDSNDSTQLRRKQLVITGEAVDPSGSRNLSHKPFDHACRRPTNAVCILSSANVADLNEWLDSIESVINQYRYSAREELDARHPTDSVDSRHFDTRRSSGSILDTLRLFEQLKNQREQSEFVDERDQQATPMVASRSLPSLAPPSPSAQLATSSLVGSGSDFSTSAFIDYYTSNPNSAATNEQDASASTTDAPYSFEDAYMSIMRRFADNELTSPLSGLPTAPLDGFVGHASSGYLDVPVSPCSFDFEQDGFDAEMEAPSSPVDPWLSQHAAQSVTSLSSSSYADDTVMQIFSEGFRRRSSSYLGVLSP